MATIYRFIIEQRQAKGGSGRKVADGVSKVKTPAKKGKTITLLGSMKGGVEHNRKMRAMNPLFNRIFGGAWEKGMRIGRAGLGLVKFNAETGAFAGLSGTAIAIIIAFIIQTLLKWQNQERQLAEKMNAQNYKQMENGIGAIRGAFKVSQNLFNGRITFNENK